MFFTYNPSFTVGMFLKLRNTISQKFTKIKQMTPNVHVKPLVKTPDLKFELQ